MIRLELVKLWKAQRVRVIDTTSHEQYMLELPSAGADLGLRVRSHLSGSYPVNVFFPSPSLSSLFSLKGGGFAWPLFKGWIQSCVLENKEPTYDLNSLARAPCVHMYEGYLPLYSSIHTLHRLL